MKIASLAHRLGTDTVSNLDVIDRIRAQSRTFDGDLDATLDRTLATLERAGFCTRRWFRESDNLLEQMLACAEQALAPFAREEIGTVVYVGVGRHFLEPASAALIAKKLGLRAHCFDLIEACQSWTRATFVVDGLYRGDAIRGKTLIVNCEVHAIKGIRGGERFGIGSPRDLVWKFPTYTIGDAITATVIEAEDQHHDWQWANLPELADLCYLPLSGAEDYRDAFEGIDGTEVETFYSDGRSLHHALVPQVIARGRALLDRSPDFRPDAVFGHTSSPQSWEVITRELGVFDQLYSIAEHTGNLVSASVPTAMSMAVEAGRLLRGDDVLVLFGAAGGSALAHKLRF